MPKLKNESYIDFSRLICFVMAIFSAHDFLLHFNDADRINMSLGKGVDENNPVVKWVKHLMDKYDVNDLIDEHIIGEEAPADNEECQQRLINFFTAFEKETGYKPEEAIRDIRKFMN
jgi:hypothetical protein